MRDDDRIEPIRCGDAVGLTFRQLDRLNGFPKGSSFRLFKRGRDRLREGVDYFWLDGADNADLLERLRREGLVYEGTVNLTLITESGYGRLRER